MDLPFGPWKKVLSADWNNVPLIIYRNEGGMLLFVFFNSEGAEIESIRLLAKQFVSADPLGKKERKAIDSVDGASIVQKGGIEAVVLSRDAEGIEYSYGAFEKALGEINAGIAGDKKELKAKGIRIGKIGKDEMDDLMKDPVVVFAVPGGGGQLAETVAKRPGLFVGADSSEARVELAPGRLDSIAVVGQDEDGRINAVQVICESALLAKIPVVIVGSREGVSNLARQNPNHSEFKRFGMSNIAPDFEVEERKLGASHFIDLSNVSKDSFLTAFNLEKAPFADTVSVMFEEFESHSLAELSKNADNAVRGKKTMPYLLEKMKRALATISSYCDAFGEDDGSLSKLGSGEAKAYFVDTSSMPEAANMAVQDLCKRFAGAKGGKKIGFFFAVLEPIDGLLPETAALLRKLSEKNVSVIVCAESEVDLKGFQPSTLLEIIGQKEAVYKAEDGKKRRFFLRPAYSKPI